MFSIYVTLLINISYAATNLFYLYYFIIVMLTLLPVCDCSIRVYSSDFVYEYICFHCIMLTLMLQIPKMLKV